MATSGLVLTLSSEPKVRRRALEALAREPSLTLGPSKDGRFAAVLETPSFREDADAFHALEAVEGVLAVELVVAYDAACAELMSAAAPSRSPAVASELVPLRVPRSQR